MTVESKKLLQHDAPIIREARSIEDPAGDASGPNAKPKPTPDGGPANTMGRAIEIGGRDGPEPTRYGDWEKGGRCIDF